MLSVGGASMDESTGLVIHPMGDMYVSGTFRSIDCQFGTQLKLRSTFSDYTFKYLTSGGVWKVGVDQDMFFIKVGIVSVYQLLKKSKGW